MNRGIAILLTGTFFLSIGMGFISQNKVAAQINEEPQIEEVSMVSRSRVILAEEPKVEPEPETFFFSDLIQVEVTQDQFDKVSAEVIEYEDEIVMLAKLIYREARGIKSDAEKAAVAWCVLNRVDSPKYGDSIKKVVTARHQFAWRSRTPVWDNLYELAKDVVTRWLLEKEGFEEVGRTLPSDYLFFAGRRGHNFFRQAYKSRKYWDWSLPDPYQLSEDSLNG